MHEDSYIKIYKEELKNRLSVIKKLYDEKKDVYTNKMWEKLHELNNKKREKRWLRSKEPLNLESFKEKAKKQWDKYTSSNSFSFRQSRFPYYQALMSLKDFQMLRSHLGNLAQNASDDYVFLSNSDLNDLLHAEKYYKHLDSIYYFDDFPTL